MLRHRRRGREGTLVPRSLTLEEQSPLFFMWCRNARCLLFRSWPGRYAGPEQRRVTSSTKHFNIQHHSAQYQCHPFALVYRGHSFNRNSILLHKCFVCSPLYRNAGLCLFSSKFSQLALLNMNLKFRFSFSLQFLK